MLRVHGNQRSDFFAFETEVAIGVIFEYRDFILGHQFHQFLSAFQGHAAAGGVLVVRDDIDEFDIRCGFQIFFQFFGDDAVVVSRYFDVFRLFEIKSADSAQVSRAFAEDDVAFVQEDTAGDVETLLGTGNDHDVLGFHFVHAHRLVHSVHAVSDSLTQAHEAQGRAVLHSAGAIFLADFDSYFGQFFQRESLRSRQAACEGNDIRLSSQRQKGSQVRRSHLFKYIRKTNCHSNLSFQNRRSPLIYMGNTDSIEESEIIRNFVQYFVKKILK